MWVLLHNLPIGISFSAAKSIVSEVGKVFENNLDEEYEGNNFVCVRVGVDMATYASGVASLHTWIGTVQSS